MKFSEVTRPGFYVKRLATDIKELYSAGQRATSGARESPLTMPFILGERDTKDSAHTLLDMPKNKRRRLDKNLERQAAFSPLCSPSACVCAQLTTARLQQRHRRGRARRSRRGAAGGGGQEKAQEQQEEQRRTAVRRTRQAGRRRRRTPRRSLTAPAPPSKGGAVERPGSPWVAGQAPQEQQRRRTKTGRTKTREAGRMQRSVRRSERLGRNTRKRNGHTQN